MLVGKPEVRRPLVAHRDRWEDNIRRVRVSVCGLVSYEQGTELLDTINGRKSLDKLTNCYFNKKEAFVTRNY